MRALLEVLPGLVLLYGTFLLGQVNMKRKYKDRRDPLPVIQAARHVVVSDEICENVPGNLHVAVAALASSLDKWDLTPTK